MATARRETAVPHDPTSDAGDAVAFTQLYRSHLASVRAYASASLPPADVDDVVSEVFVLAWQRRDTIPEEWPRGWLIGVTRNIARSRRRSARRAATYLDRLGDQRPQAAPGPAETHLATEHFEALEAAMQTLRPADQEILMFAGPYEMAVGDIAEALGISANNVGVRIHRARQRLRRAFERTTTTGGDAA